MKRVGYLITKEKVTLDLCKDAIMKASRHKRSRKSVKVVIDNLDYYALELRNMVLYDLYEPAEYGHAVKIEHGKERYLSKPKFFPDQCIHNLIFMLGEKQFYNHIDPHSISSIPGRGIRYGHKLLSGRTNGSKQSVKFIQNHPNKKFRIYYGKGVSYYKIFTYRAVDMLGMKYSNTGIGWRKKNLKKLKRECLAFHLKHKHFTNRRAMGLLSLISYKHLYSSDKVWKFVTSHVNISQLKYIAYGDDYLERRIRKAKHRKGEYSSFPHKIMYSVEFIQKKKLNKQFMIP